MIIKNRVRPEWHVLIPNLHPDVSDKLREYGWQVPAYTMPEHAEDVAVLRIVIREGFSQDMACMLLDDIRKAVNYYEDRPGHKPKGPAPQFNH
jgi:glutamate decarboxylase